MKEMNEITDDEDTWDNIMNEINRSLDALRSFLFANSGYHKIEALRKGNLFSHQLKKQRTSQFADFDSKSGA